MKIKLLAAALTLISSSVMANDFIVLKSQNNVDNQFERLSSGSDIDKIALEFGLGIQDAFPSLESESFSKNNGSSTSTELDLFKFIDVSSLSDEEKSRLLDVAKRSNSYSEAYLMPKPQLLKMPVPTASIESSSTYSYPQNMQSEQGYLNAAPYGVDALWAWQQPGGNAAGVVIGDMENGYLPSHVDLPHVQNFGKPLADDKSHGTGVLGVLGAKNDGKGITGIAYGASFEFSHQDMGLPFASYIKGFADRNAPGSVLLFELVVGFDWQNRGNDFCSPQPLEDGTLMCFVAVEYYSIYRAAIEYATGKGIHVVSPSGNNVLNYDHPSFGNLWNTDYVDSGSVIVGASNSGSRTPASFTSYGNRVDVHGWGHDVATTMTARFDTSTQQLVCDYGVFVDQNSCFTKGFNGTSSASPIVAGTIASIHAILKEKYGVTLSPKEMRSLISRTATQQTGGLDRQIGGLPSIREAVEFYDQQRAAQLLLML